MSVTGYTKTGADTAFPARSAAGRDALALVDYSKLLPFYASLSSRANARVNVVMLGASIVEGFPVTSFTRTIGAGLASLLRARFPTPGVTSGGRGYIGIPTAVVAGASWPLVFTGGVVDETTFPYGGKHSVWYANAATSKFVDTLTSPVTSFDINLLLDPLGSANSGYYKIDGGTAVPFNTFAAATTVSKLHVASPATTSIEVGWNAAGYILCDGVTEYNGDENAGIQVHNCGHASYSTTQWAATNSKPTAWPQSIAALNPAVLILQDTVVNDASTGNGNKTSAQAQPILVAFIAQLRAAGITCPILLSAAYDVTGGLAFPEPWANYVSMMQQVALADPTVAFVDHSARMPSTAAASQYSLYHTDHIHGNANGNAYQLMAATLATALSPR